MLTFLKQYSSEYVLSQAVECTPKTFYEWVLEVLTALNKWYNDVVSTNFTNFKLTSNNFLIYQSIWKTDF